MSRKPFRDYRFSLRVRTTTWYVGLMAVALTVFSIGIYVGLRSYLKTTLQRGLSSNAETIANDFLTKLPTKGDAWVMGEIRESYEDSPNDHYIRLSEAHTVLYRTADMTVPSVRIDRISLPRPSTVGAFHRQSVDGQVVLVYSRPFHTHDGQIIEVEAGTCIFTMQETLHSLTLILYVATVVTLILAMIGGFLLMKQPLRPLALLTEKATHIGRKELGERLPVIPTGDELERLTHSLNGMIDRLEDALDHNRRFSADASHELRTPLTIMRGEIEEMLRIEDLPMQAIENLVSTLEEIDRMSRMVNSLMAITRLDAGGERMEMKALNLSTLVQTTMDHMRLLAEEKNLPLNVSCEREVYIYADPMRIKQVLVNLIDNAVKYSPSGTQSSSGESADSSNGLDETLSSEVQRYVDVGVSAVNGFAHLRVADHGIGISEEVLPHIFDRFYRADFARSREAGGVGLGLAIVKAIVVAHEGSVSITSVLGQGSTALVLLPLASQNQLPPINPEQS